MTRGVSTVKRTLPFGPSTTCDEFGAQAKRSAIAKVKVSKKRKNDSSAAFIIIAVTTVGYEAEKFLFWHQWCLVFSSVSALDL